MNTATKEAVGVRGLQTVYVTVRNFQRSLEFYREVFGAEEEAIIPWGKDRDEKGAFFELPDGTKVIISYELAHAAGPRRQYLWLELQVDDPERFYEHLKERGIQVKQSPAHTTAGSFAFDVTDPDGNDIRIGTGWKMPAGI